MKKALWLLVLVVLIAGLGWLRWTLDKEIHRRWTLEVLEEQRAKP